MLKCLKAQPKDLTSSQPARSVLVVSSVVLAWTNTHVHSGMCLLSSREVPLTSWHGSDASTAPHAPHVHSQSCFRDLWDLNEWYHHPCKRASQKPELTHLSQRSTSFTSLSFLKASMLILHHHHPSSNYMMFVGCIFKILDYNQSLQSGLPLSTSDLSQSTLFPSTGLCKMQTNHQVILLLQALCWLSLAFRIKTELPNMASPPCVAWPYHVLSSSVSYHQRPSHTLPVSVVLPKCHFTFCHGTLPMLFPRLKTLGVP